MAIPKQQKMKNIRFWHWKVRRYWNNKLVQWLALVNTLMNILIHSQPRNFLASWATTRFSS